jgi:hypothetical protein
MLFHSWLIVVKSSLLFLKFELPFLTVFYFVFFFLLHLWQYAYREHLCMKVIQVAERETGRYVIALSSTSSRLLNSVCFLADLKHQFDAGEGANDAWPKLEDLPRHTPSQPSARTVLSALFVPLGAQNSELGAIFLLRDLWLHVYRKVVSMCQMAQLSFWYNFHQRRLLFSDALVDSGLDY